MQKACVYVYSTRQISTRNSSGEQVLVTWHQSKDSLSSGSAG